MEQAETNRFDELYQRHLLLLKLQVSGIMASCTARQKNSCPWLN
ncbi:hypothetical protein ACFL0Q_00595 [Thermodesulfobacteriota bacterium]